MSPAPTVSVIVPTYERRELVKRAIASVFAQTYRDFELIVVDDGSTDGTAEALALLGDCLRYLWQENRGVAAARNAGLALARGSIVAFLDDDDRWLPDHLAVVTEVLQRQPEAVLVSTSPRHLIGGRAHPYRARLEDPLPSQLFASPVGWPSCIAVRTEAVRSVGGFDERLPVAEDRDLWTRLALLGRPFALLQRRTAIRRYSNSSLMISGRRRGDYLAAFELRAERAIAELEARGANGSPGNGTVSQALGARRFVAAWRALAEGDERAARTTLEDACRLLPELSQEPELVENVLCFLPSAHDPRERQRHLTTTARLWPDPHADTALFLRLLSIVAALRRGRLRQLADLVREWPLRPTPGFARRSSATLVRRVRLEVDAYRYRQDDGDRSGSRVAV